MLHDVAIAVFALVVTLLLLAAAIYQMVLDHPLYAAGLLIMAMGVASAARQFSQRKIDELKKH